MRTQLERRKSHDATVIRFISTSNLQNTVGDEVFTSSIALNNSLNQVFRYIGVVRQQLLGVFRQAVSTVAKYAIFKAFSLCTSHYLRSVRGDSFTTHFFGKIQYIGIK